MITAQAVWGRLGCSMAARAPPSPEHRSVGSATVTGYVLCSDPHTPAVGFPSGLREAFTRNCGGGWGWGVGEDGW